MYIYVYICIYVNIYIYLSLCIGYRLVVVICLYYIATVKNINYEI